MFMVIEWTTSDLLTALILLNRAMRNCRIQSTNCLQKVHVMHDGMHINVVKTKTEENDAKVNIDGQAIENVKTFRYILEASLHEIMTVPKTYKD